MRTKKLLPVQLLKGIVASSESLNQPFNQEQEEILVDVLCKKRPEQWIPVFRNKGNFTQEQATMIGTALQQNYSTIPTLLPSFEEEGFQEAVIEGIKETVKAKGKITKEELINHQK